jgi:hypothetical protein
MNIHLKRLALATLALIVGLLLIEACANIYMRMVRDQGRLFREDTVLGWRPLSNLTLYRTNADGNRWFMQTNEEGFRGELTWAPNAEHRVLIVGDSFAFGEGINVEERFDLLLSKKHPRWSFVNIGVMGWGTDQEILAADRYFKSLRAGDAVVLLVCGNDFFDNLRQSYSGRPKPWVELTPNGPSWHHPRLTVFTSLRDKSYLVALLLIALANEQNEASASEILKSLRITEAILSPAIDRLSAHGVEVILAHHRDFEMQDTDGLDRLEVDRFWNRLCGGPRRHCISLDDQLSPSSNDLLFSDYHWNQAGNKLVANILDQAITKAFEQETGTP